MNFLELFKRLFSKKEPEVIRVEKVKKVIKQNLNAKIKADIKKQKELPRFATDAEAGFIDPIQEDNEKEMRRLIEKKRKERLAKERAARASTKKKLKPLSSNF